jgi:ribosomal protein L35
MPKMKTRKGLAKRIRVTRNGKLIRDRMIPKAKKWGHRDRLHRNISAADAAMVRRGIGA